MLQLAVAVVSFMLLKLYVAHGAEQAAGGLA
jgi:hypothetical protein